MQVPIPIDESLRLEELLQLELLDTPYEEVYDSLAALTAELTGCPISLISLVAEERQWFKARHGCALEGTSRQEAFCSHTIMHDELLLVPDAATDDRFRDNPLVTGPLGVRFYAGHPFYGPTGKRIGTVCVLDQQPRNLTAGQQAAMKTLALQVTKLVELHHRNHELARIAREQLELETATLQQLLHTQVEERELVGYELEEHFAQVLAATQHHLALAQQEPATCAPLLSKVRTTLADLAQSMRHLSLTIAPTCSLNIANEERMRKYISVYEDTTGAKVFLTLNGNLELVEPRKMTHIFRIIAEQLQLFESAHTLRKRVHIRLDVSSELKLSIWAEGNRNGHAQPEQRIANNSIRKRSTLIDAAVQTGHNEFSDQVLNVVLPL